MVIKYGDLFNAPVKDSEHENVGTDEFSLGRPIFWWCVRAQVVDVIVLDGACDVNINGCLMGTKGSRGFRGTEQKFLAQVPVVRVLADKAGA